MSMEFLKRAVFAVMLMAVFASGQWTSLPSLPDMLGEVTAAVIGLNLYVVGQGTSNTYKYSFTSKTWSTNLAKRPFVGDHHGAVVTPDGSWMLVGGFGGNSEGKAQLYNPGQNSWSTFSLPSQYGGSICATFTGGFVYFCGGISAGNTISNCGKYNYATKAFSSMPSLPKAVNHAACATDGAQIYMVGGRGGINIPTIGYNTLQVFNIQSNSWQSSDTNSNLAPLPVGRGGMGVGLYVGGEVYVIGGETPLTAPNSPTNGAYSRVDIYNPTSNKWRTGPSLPQAMHGIFPTFDGKNIYIAGGGIKVGYSVSNLVFSLDVPVLAPACSYTTWSATPCSSSCGSGTLVNTSMSTMSGCPNIQRSQPCTRPACVLNCSVSQWSAYSACSASCGNGTSTRTRFVTTPASGGGSCLYPLIDSGRCNIQPCPVNCAVSQWSMWSGCSATCNGGTQTRTRNIIRPSSGGGKACPTTIGTAVCGTNPCPVNCTLSAWTAFTPCSATCGGGTQTQQRFVLQQASNGGSCGSLTNTMVCNPQPCPVDCTVTQWSPWSACSTTCGTGTQSRSRGVATSPTNGGAACPTLTATRSCSTAVCPVDCQQAWSAFSPCSASCGAGQAMRKLSIIQPAVGTGAACGPNSTEIVACNMGPCPQACVLDAWSSWSSCSQSCNGGSRTRQRVILSEAQNGGTCDNTTQHEACGTVPCPVDCVLSDWSAWSASCSAVCGDGVLRRTRNVLVASVGSGLPCDITTATLPCSNGPCVDCVVGPWSVWSACASTCTGPTNQSRTRAIVQAAGAGGQSCPNLVETADCPKSCVLTSQLSANTNNILAWLGRTNLGGADQLSPGEPVSSAKALSSSVTLSSAAENGANTSTLMVRIMGFQSTLGNASLFPTVVSQCTVTSVGLTECLLTSAIDLRLLISDVTQTTSFSLRLRTVACAGPIPTTASALLCGRCALQATRASPQIIPAFGAGAIVQIVDNKTGPQATVLWKGTLGLPQSVCPGSCPLKSLGQSCSTSGPYANTCVCAPAIFT